MFVDNQRGSFSLLKTSDVSGEYLTGAVFGLFSDPDCTQMVMQSIDYDDGTYYFGDLGFNTTYYLKELTAPDGFDKDNTVYTVTVSETGAISVSPELEHLDGQYVFPNVPAYVFELPDTGSAAGLSWMVSVSMFTLAGLTLLIMNRPKKKSERR